ncbi:hypothetical protein R1flu_010107 [Riccia fluitans]|uniref:Uncharacterized protein n=1 Tax=Riccia fluitans TaxID=41844 RepID=A0ABD1Z477_9MARC
MSGGNHSPNLGLLDQEASMQNIDRFVEALEMEARESRMSKRRKLFSDEPSNSALQVYQPLDREEPSSSAIQDYQSLERELFQPTWSSIGTTSEYIMDLSTAGLSKLVDFSVKEECHRIVPPSEVEAEFLKLIGRKYKKDVWQDIAPWFGFSLNHSQPSSEGWIMDDFKKFSLEGHLDGYALDKQVCLVINRVQRMVDKANCSFFWTTLVLLAIAHVHLGMADYHPDWHMWVFFEIRSRLGHDRNDKID